MIKKIGVGAAAAAVALSTLVTASQANAQAYNTSFITSITYMNVGTAAANVSAQFYPEANGTPINVPLAQLNKNAGTSVFLGNVTGVNVGFVGSAVLSADQPVLATMVQVPPTGSTVVNRPLANGFSSGASKFLIATVLKNKFNASTKFSVQNVDTEALKVTVAFYNAEDTSAAPITKVVDSLPAGSAKYFDAGTIAELGSVFNGSAQITATKADGSAGNVVAAAMELSTNSTGASSFEGVTQSSTKYYMSSALCNFEGTSTAYAIQNTGDAGAGDAVVKVTYLPGGATETQTIPVGTKGSFLGCTNKAGNKINVDKFLGSAVIESTGNTIVAIGKATGNGLSTAFLGAAEGSSKLALPYVRWTTTGFNPTGNRQRTFIAIQNLGDALAAGDVKVHYLDKDGNEVGVASMPAIATNGKVNSSGADIGAAGAEFGYYADKTFGGSVIIEGPAGSKLAAIARVKSQTSTVQVGEDYNAIPIE